MTTTSPNVQAALATLRDRWGGAAPRWGVARPPEKAALAPLRARGGGAPPGWGVPRPPGGAEVVGALAVAPQPNPAPATSDERAISTGFRALDGILGLCGRAP